MLHNLNNNANKRITTTKQAEVCYFVRVCVRMFLISRICIRNVYALIIIFNNRIVITMYHRLIEIIEIHWSSSSPRYRILLLLLFFLPLLHANTLARCSIHTAHRSLQFRYKYCSESLHQIITQTFVNSITYQELKPQPKQKQSKCSNW